MTSLAQALLANEPVPPRARPYAVELRRWKEPGMFDVVMPCGVILHGCRVHVWHGERRVRAPGYNFATREDETAFREAVLAAVDAEE